MELPLSQVHAVESVSMPMLLSMIQASDANAIRYALVQDWTNWDTIYKRVGFVPATPEKPQPEPPPPLNPGF